MFIGVMILATMIITFYLNLKPGDSKSVECLFLNLEALTTPEDGILADDCVLSTDFVAQEKGAQWATVCDSRTGAKIYPCLPPKKE